MEGRGSGGGGREQRSGGEWWRDRNTETGERVTDVNSGKCENFLFF